MNDQLRDDLLFMLLPVAAVLGTLLNVAIVRSRRRRRSTMRRHWRSLRRAFPEMIRDSRKGRR